MIRVIIFFLVSSVFTPFDLIGQTDILFKNKKNNKTHRISIERINGLAFDTIILGGQVTKFKDSVFTFHSCFMNDEGYLCDTTFNLHQCDVSTIYYCRKKDPNQCKNYSGNKRGLLYALPMFITGAGGIVAVITGSTGAGISLLGVSMLMYVAQKIIFNRTQFYLNKWDIIE